MRGKIARLPVLSNSAPMCLIGNAAATAVMENRVSPWAARLLAPLTLLEWGGILVYFYCSHRLTALLHPYFHLLVLVTGLLLLASSVCVFLADDGPDSPSDHECDGAFCDRSCAGITSRRFLAFLLLSVPIALAAFISPDFYGSVMIRNRGVSESLEKTQSDTVAASIPQPAATQNGEFTAVEVGDLLMAAQTPSGAKAYNGKRVELVGQVFPLGENRFELVRTLILCCAADAQMLAVRVESDRDLDVSSMKWAKVRGRVGFTIKDGHSIPVVNAEKVLIVQQPVDPYVYRGGSMPTPVHRSNFKVQLPPR